MLISFVTLFSWLALINYTICFIPQVIENYRLKTTQGWSNFFILMYLAGFIGLLFYIFCLDLPLAYKALVPLQTSLMLVIIAQRFYYDQAMQDKQFLTLFSLLMLITISIFPLLFFYPTIIGHCGGWLSLTFLILFPIPQIIKIFKEKSVEGFSLSFLTIFTLASLSELIVACTGALPLQTVLMIIKNLITSIIFYVQFWLYKRKIDE